MTKETDILGILLALSALGNEKKAKEETTTTDFRATAKEIGEKLKEAQLGYIDAGFTEEQAFELMMNAMRK